MEEKLLKILIINPPAQNTIAEYPDAKGEKYIESDDFGRFPPLGALYVLTYLQKHTNGHELFFKDCVGENMSMEDLKTYLSDVKPDIVGITSFTMSLIDVVGAARLVREINPSAHICLGGHHPTSFPVEAAALKEFDSIIVGEGELAFSELVEAVASGLPVTGITGVYTQESIGVSERCAEDGRFLVKNKLPAGYVDNIDSLPFPDRRFISHISYQSVVGVSAKLATIISSRGCPFKCTFCDVPYKKYRERSLERVIDEVERCLEMGYEEVHFYDDLFNMTPQRLHAVSDEIKKRGLIFPWDFRGRVNCVDRESLCAAKEAGCRMISFGVETGTDEGLLKLKKGITVEQVKKAFDWCRDLGIRTIVDFMVGLPTERSEDDVEANIDFLISLKPDYAQIAVLVLYPHTELYHEAVAKGLAEAGRWEKFSLEPSRDFKVDHWTEFMPAEKLAELRKKAYVKFYMRPSYILKSVVGLESFYQFKVKAAAFLKLLK